MTVSTRSVALGFGLGVALVAGSSAFAAPLSLPKGRAIQPTKNLPGKPIPPTSVIPRGLTSSATLTPRSLYASGVALNIQRAPQVETTANRVKLDKHTQLWIHFRAEKNTEYSVDCQFSGSKSILTMDYAGSRFLRQQTTAPSASGRLNHRLYARPATEDVRVYLQASGDLDWSSCTVSPAS